MWDHHREKVYNAIPDSDVEDSNSNSSSDGLLDGQHIRKQTSSRKRSTAVQIVVLGISIAIGLGAGFWLGRRGPGDLNYVCTKHTSEYSPVLDQVPITYGEWQFNGSFTQENIYRQDPSKEVDDAWNALGINNRVLVITEEEGRRSGLSPENHVRVNKRYGGGYPVMNEGMHQLHCLNLLRKSLWFQYDHYYKSEEGEFVTSNQGQPFRWHVTHCLDFLRQRLMCDVDIGVFGAVWYNASDPRPFVDFNTKHVCKNFDAVRQWATDHQTDEDLPDDYWEDPGPEVIIRPDIP